MTEVKTRLNELIDSAVKTHDRVTITRRGKPVVVLISVDDRALEETIHWQSQQGVHDDIHLRRTRQVDELSVGDCLDGDLALRHQDASKSCAPVPLACCGVSYRVGARTRSALLEAAARRLSTHGYANLAVERVAGEAGYTRGAVYHLFANKEELALAVVTWVEETWEAEVGHLVAGEAEPLEALMTLARGHAIFCRRDVARVLLTLRVEFAGQDHPVGRAIAEIIDRLDSDCADLIAAGRARGAIPPGPPPKQTAAAYTAIVEAVGIELAGQAPYDIELVDRAVRGVLGLTPVARSSTAPAGAH